MMKDASTVKDSKGHLAIEKEDVKLVLDMIIKTQRGQLFCVNIQRKTEWSNSGFDVSKDMAHKLLGHSNLEATMLLERQLGWKFTGTMHKCNS